MDSVKQIMYGVTDFARMRAENGYFVDRTGLISELEKTSYAMFLRPRRFGKSLWCSVLQCYYDRDYADCFDELFGGLDIGRNPTAEHGKYLFIDFNFTGVEKQFDRVQESFNDYCSERLDVFAERHVGLLPAGTAEAILAKRSCHEKLNALTTRLKGSDAKLYVCIDEYDNFTNFETMRRWYDNYRFSPDTGADGAEPPHVANPTLVFYYMQYFLRNHKPQPELIDRNLRTDYMKIRHIITEGRKVNGNFHRLEDLIARLGARPAFALRGRSRPCARLEPPRARRHGHAAPHRPRLPRW